MDKLLLKKAAIQSVALMVAVITFSYTLKHYQAVTIAASNNVEASASEQIDYNNQNPITKLSLQTEVSEEAVLKAQKEAILSATLTSVGDLYKVADESILKQLSDTFLVIRKPQGDGLNLSLEDLYINKSIRLTMSGLLEDNNLSSNMIYRVRNNELYVDNPIYTEVKRIEVDKEDQTTQEIITRDYGRDLCHGITIISHRDEVSNLVHTQLLLELDGVYAYNIYEDANYYFIDLRKPSEVYGKILVIDAGHGGKDAGALSKDEKYYEKDINLGILLQLKRLLDKEKIKIYYTRIADDKVFLRPRVELANAVEADFFISIHCNANKITGPQGTEVLYYNKKPRGVPTEDLAKLFSVELSKMITLKNRGIVLKHPEDIFIMDHSVVPTLLIEVGYMTNQTDMEYLSKAENQEAVAQGIYNGIQIAYERYPRIK